MSLMNIPLFQILVRRRIASVAIQEFLDDLLSPPTLRILLQSRFHRWRNLLFSGFSLNNAESRFININRNSHLFQETACNENPVPATLLPHQSP
jgi:hypothetical protein